MNRACASCEPRLAAECVTEPRAAVGNEIKFLSIECNERCLYLASLPSSRVELENQPVRGTLSAKYFASTFKLLQFRRGQSPPIIISKDMGHLLPVLPSFQLFFRFFSSLPGLIALFVYFLNSGRIFTSLTAWFSVFNYFSKVPGSISSIYTVLNVG